MKIKHDIISPAYHQVYFTFSPAEMQNAYRLVRDMYSLEKPKSKKAQKQLDEMVVEHLEGLMDEEIANLDVIAVSWKQFRYLCETSPDQGLVVICQFCVLPPGTEIHFPPKIPTELLHVELDQMIFEDFVKQLLTANHFDYDEPQKKVTDRSLVSYDLRYMQDDFLINHLENRSISFTTVNQKQFRLFLNKAIGEEVVLDNDDGVLVKAKITGITEKRYPPLSDKLVAQCRFLNTKTVAELTDKVTEIYRYSTIVMVVVDYLVEFIWQTQVFVPDEFVINHFYDSSKIPTNPKEREVFLQGLNKYVIKEYLLSLMDLNYRVDVQKLIKKIQEEYEFDKTLFFGSKSFEDYPEYLERHLLEAKVFQYCLDKGIVELPK